MPDEFEQEPPINNKAGQDEEEKGSGGDSVNMAGAVANASSQFGMFKAGSITINNYNNPFSSTLDRLKDPKERKKQEARYRVGSDDMAPDADEESEEGVEDTPLPTSTAELNTWFYGLNDYEQCFVLAMTAFYGMSVGMIRDKAEELHKPLRDMEKDEVKEGLRESREPQKRLPRTEFLKSLYIISSYSGGVDRLYWRDKDENGDSAFGTRLLLYIAKEGALKFGAREGLRFQEQLQDWVENNDENVSWHAARALGTFWCRQNKNRLYGKVDGWAKSNDERDWHRAAWCLDGVYKIERVISNDTEDNIGNHVLAKLHDWAIKARETQEPTSEETTVESTGINPGNTAAITYAFLGRSTPDIAMNGLDSLLELPSSELKQNYPDIKTLLAIVDAVVFCYTDLAVNGRRVREVLQHLADYVKLACYERTNIGRGTRAEREQQQLNRECRIAAVFDILYLIANASAPDEQKRCCVSYQMAQPLPARPAFDNSDGKDLLLEGILIGEEEEWRANISTLLCAAFIERKGPTALKLLRRWAELVMKDQSEQPDEVREAFVRFMHSLGIQIGAWCHYLQRIDVTVPPATTTLRNKLETWKVPWNRQHDYIPLNLLVEEVLAGLPF